MCKELAEQGYFGPSGSFEVFGNDKEGIRAAIAWLRDQMALYPDDPIFVMGFSWGGGGALDFATLLSERGGDYLTLKDWWNGNKVPENVIIDGLILIDTVTTGRGIQAGRYATDGKAVPSNVRYALNLYAPLQAYGGLIPDHGLRNIEGALNIAMVGTDHCSIAYANCTPRLPELGRGWNWPEYDDRAGPINTRTLSLLKYHLRFRHQMTQSVLLAAEPNGGERPS